MEGEGHRLLQSAPPVTETKKWLQSAFDFLTLELREGHHPWCQYPAVCLEIVKLLYSYYTRYGKETIKKVDALMLRKSGSCVNCIDAYYRAKNSLQPEVRSVCNYLDTVRLVAARTNPKPDDKKDVWLYEMLYSFGPLLDDELCGICVNIMKDPSCRELCRDGVFVGVYYLLGHNDESIQQLMWQHHVLDVTSVEDFRRLYPLLVYWDEVLQGKDPGCWERFPNRRHVHQPQTWALWKGLVGVLSKIKEEALTELSKRSAGLVTLVFNQCGEESIHVENAVHCAKILLEGLGHEIWNIWGNSQVTTVLQKQTPNRIFEILRSLVLSESKPSLVKHAFSAILHLVTACEKRDEWDNLYGRALEFLLVQIQDDIRFESDASILGSAIKDGLKLVCFTVSSENDYTKGGQFFCDTLDVLFQGKEELLESKVRQMGLPLAAELAATMIMVDACVLGDLLGGGVKVRSCISDKLLARALQSKTSWRCIPNTWKAAAQYCGGGSKITNSRISMGILVAGAVLSHALDRSKDYNRNGGFSVHVKNSKGSLKKIAHQSSDVCASSVQIFGKETQLADVLFKAVEDHLGILSRSTEDLLDGIYVSEGWRALVLLSSGVQTVLKDLAFDLIKSLISRKDVLHESQVMQGMVEGCQENWEICMGCMKEERVMECLACLAPTVEIMQMVLDSAAGKSCDEFLQLVNKVLDAGTQIFPHMDSLPKDFSSSDLQENFILMFEMLWSLTVSNCSITITTMPTLTRALDYLLNLGPYLVESVCSPWFEAFKMVLNHFPQGARLPLSIYDHVNEILQNSTISSLVKVSLTQAVASLGKPFSTMSPAPEFGEQTSKQSDEEESNAHQGGRKKQKKADEHTYAHDPPVRRSMTRLAAAQQQKGGVTKSSEPNTRRNSQNTRRSAKNPKAGMDQMKRNAPAAVGKKRKLAGIADNRSETQKKTLQDVWRHETEEFRNNSQQVVGFGVGRIQRITEPAVNFSVPQTDYGEMLFDEDPQMVGITANTSSREIPLKTKRINIEEIHPQATRRRAAGPSAVAKKGFNIDSIHQEILQWDLPDLKSPALTSRLLDSTAQLPDKFSTTNGYYKWFRGLLLEELRAVVLSQWEEISVTRLEMMSMTVKHVQRCSCLHNITLLYQPDEQMHFRLDDLLLLSGIPVEDTEVLPDKRCLAIVRGISTVYESDGQKTLEVRVCFGSQDDGNPRSDPEQFVTNGWKCHALIITSLLTQQREFQALCNMPLLPHAFVEQILNPLPPIHTKLSIAKIGLANDLEAQLIRKYNSAQQEAIASATIGRGVFTLVQGPPGTGKTSAILGMISALLAKLPQSRKESKSDNQQASTEFEFPWKKRRKRMTKTEPKVQDRVQILICAQSNSAIDEIVARISLGEVIEEGNDSNRVPSMVRMGRLDVTHTAVQCYNIDSVCIKELESNKDATQATRANEASLKQFNQMKSDLLQAQEELRALRDTESIGQSKEHEIRDRIRSLSTNIGRIKNEIRSGQEIMDQARRTSRMAALHKARLVFSTLSSAAGELTSMCNAGQLNQRISFDALIVDEAAQAVEPALLVPLRLLRPTARVILVGDPQQLPPTIISFKAKDSGLGQSLFERFERAGHPVTMLLEQYRMHPRISRFPSQYFYQNKLVDGDGITEESRRASYHEIQCFGPFVFFDCQGRESRSQSFKGSWENVMEVELVAHLFSAARQRYQEHIKNVAIIAPYKAQVSKLKKSIEMHHQLSVAKGHGSQDLSVEVATVDSFQGREADIVIISLVRARPSSKHGAIGFLEDERRMNVALTRPRRALWVVGHAETLRTRKIWDAFISYAQNIGALITANPPFDHLLGAKALDDAFRHGKDTKRRKTNRVAEGEEDVGPGLRTAALTLPHDVDEQEDGDTRGMVGAGGEGGSRMQQTLGRLDQGRKSSKDPTSLELWKQKMGIDTEQGTGVGPRPAEVQTAAPIENKETENEVNQDKDDKDSQERPFDIDALVGDVFRSNLRSKAFVGNTAKDFRG